MSKKGKLLVISGPSGAGKSSVVFKAIEGRDDVCFSTSVTTRNPRPGEVDGREYFFVKLERFLEMIKNNELLEHLNILLAGLGHIDHCERAGESGSHLITRGGLLALVKTIRITGKDAVSGKLTNGVIGPVIHGNIHERIGGCKHRSRESNQRNNCNCCYKLLHFCVTPLLDCQITCPSCSRFWRFWDSGVG